MFDPDDIDAPDIFGDLGRDAMKVVGPLQAVVDVRPELRPRHQPSPMQEALRRLPALR